ncbi:hypoxanthine-guanine phosphoribosyltransferase [Marinospirillum sp. MEB164]|uniref:Hypoxanthine-guanine phosphoribosyltransferase n=1 Tax=Marinospirillum alkalitolerans TaxID=3123374 RepID=A0ABW8PUJ4_9GAMM
MTEELTLALKKAQQILADADCLITEEQISAAFDRMAEDVTAELGERLPLIFSVMNGGLFATSELVKRLKFPLEMDYMHATRYRMETKGGELDWRVSPQVSLKDRYVLVVDDILDEGATLAAIMEFCRAQGAAGVYSAVLVDKKHDRKAFPDLKASFTGLEVEDRFLFGCGMDFQGYFRNLPAIYAPQGL